ncbi:NAD(P)H-dependent oxidoreductase [Metabacillus sp. GX 13764]|uniref:NADPH-dependent FMN reductase n=1 Tax=Metabacillus kandeliae TaxID=2900151 RepID=UPI001E31DD1C|nr:NADPH-dependent FMN reductase [Metabacillus kandeliae]MCD7035213.1 NAD(P)H-dependent oxidoreductase [Metabacillus kandeliae]
MKLTVLSGGPRKTGRTRIAAKHIADKYGAELADLSELELPVFAGEPSQYELESVKTLQEKVKDADGIVLISPEYHGGMTGALKNALDFLNSDYFAQKSVALLTVAGGGKGGINTLNQLRVVMRALYANAIPKQLVLDPHCFDAENDDLFEEPAALVKELMNELQAYTKMTNELRKG